MPNLLFRDEHHTTFLRHVKHLKSADGFNLILQGGVTVECNVIRYFTLRKTIFIWYPHLSLFHRVFDFDEQVPSKTIYDCLPLDELEIRQRLSVYGPNEIAVNLTPLHMLMFKEVCIVRKNIIQLESTSDLQNNFATALQQYNDVTLIFMFPALFYGHISFLINFSLSTKVKLQKQLKIE